MKLRTSFVGFLLGLTLICLALSPATSYAQSFKYILVVILYEDGQATRSRIYPMESAAECKGAKEGLEAEAQEKKVDIWAGCMEVKRAPELRKQRDS